jgi:serine/threonine protein kinase
MQLIRGRSLAQLIRQMRQAATVGQARREAGVLDLLRSADTTGDRCLGLGAGMDTGSTSFFRAAVQLGIQGAEALGHAHRSGIVHGHVKPSNLLLGEQGDLWITDFGMDHLEGEAGMVVARDRLVTVRHMSPEQIAGPREAADCRSDIFSLGASLYELLTLSLPFPATDQQALRNEILQAQPPPLRKLNRNVPSDLERIVLKSMRKAPQDRYRSVEDLANDLRRFLGSKPLSSRPAKFLSSLVRWWTGVRTGGTTSD